MEAQSSMLIYAVRYCLTRRSYAVGECVSYLHENWYALAARQQRQIQADIEACLAERTDIDSFLAQTWQAILSLPVREDDTR